MAQILDWHNESDQSGIVHHAARALLAGHLVAFPTETVYGLAASALVPEAVERLRMSKGRPEEKPLTLALGSAAEALDWVPEMSPLGRRLSRRCWPGPVTIVFHDPRGQGLVSRLAASVRQSVCPVGKLGLRVPAHETVLQTLRLVGAPLVLTSANRSGAAPATCAREVMESVGEMAELVIDDGPSRYGHASTVVEVNGDSWSVLRAGVLSEADIKRQTAKLIVFVCSGNTCRSPMAEVLCKKFLAQELACSPEELVQRGIIVLSAGLAAMMGEGAAGEAVQAARELGADLSGHSSRPLSASLVAQADELIAMTRSHLLALASRFPNLGPRPRLLCPDGNDLPDPIGCDQNVYRQCAQQINRHLQALLPEIKK
jgi:tRNA threonylcarbamoyl adenosine modification protein (Sua5/YciO/YrdC/YwlC family)